MLKQGKINLLLACLLIGQVSTTPINANADVFDNQSGAPSFGAELDNSTSHIPGSEDMYLEDDEGNRLYLNDPNIEIVPFGNKRPNESKCSQTSFSPLLKKLSRSNSEGKIILQYQVKKVPLTNGTDPLWMNFSESLDSDGRGSTFVDGFSLYGWRYQKNIKAVYDWTDFGSNGNSYNIPAPVAYLNSGNSYYGYETEKYSVFISTNSEQTVNPTRPETVGITFKSDLGNGSMVTNTVGQIKENGFFGLNSEDDFGFDKEMKNFFFVSDLKKKYHDTEFHVRFENYSSPNSYNSRVMSWSNISLSKITFDIGHNWNNQRIGVSVKSPMVASGQFKSKIRGLNSLSDFYHEDEAIQLSYKADLKRVGFLEVVASNDQKHSVKLSYGINF